VGRSVGRSLSTSAGLVWFGLVWFGLVWFGLVWFGLAWLGLAWLGLAGQPVRPTTTPVRPTAPHNSGLQIEPTSSLSSGYRPTRGQQSL
jgi:hypothetical protein